MPSLSGASASRTSTSPLAPRSHCSLHRSLSPCALARLVAEARRWFAFATERGLPTRYAAEKALGALALSARPIQSACSVSVRSARPDADTGDEEAYAHGVALAVPTKLIGTSAFQPALRALRASRAPAGLTLRLAVDRGRIAVFAGERLLGLVQPKHGWLTPLVAHGASAVLLRVTGDPARGHTLGVNVAFTGLGDAIRAVERATVERAEKRTGNAVAALGPTARRDPHPAA